MPGVELVLVVLGARAVIPEAARLIGADPALAAMAPAGTGRVGHRRRRLIGVGGLLNVTRLVGIARSIAVVVIGAVAGGIRRRGADQRTGAKADRRRRVAAVRRVARRRRRHCEG